jgi:EAL domain-containing protein (putative c-di-GMP-specific phosphodiesterase class I)
MLQNLGVEIVIDDFGASDAATDFSPSELRDAACAALDVLGRFPLDLLKFDPRFVERLASVERIGAVVDAAHAAGLRTAALAVEDEAMADRAFDAGFDLAQGFHFARPERPSRIDELLASP